MKLKLFLAGLFILLLNYLKAQPYKSSVGVRLGYPTSISAKSFVSDNKAIEAFFGYRSYSQNYATRSHSWFMLGAAVTKQEELKDLIEGLHWYGGAGASIFRWSWNPLYYNPPYNYTTVGLLAQGGLEYVLPSYPLTVSVDWMPMLSIGRYGTYFGADYGAVSVRYIFKKTKASSLK
jgi:hypothetical protein